MSDMTRREFGRKLAKGIGAAAIAPAAVMSFASKAAAAAAKKPNIVFICSDQHAWKYAGFAGHPFVKTPNLDKIARRGVVFNNAYTGNPVCAAGRSGMMTGLYPSDCNSFCNSTVWDGSHPLWSKRLQEAGYYTWATGKFDLNPAFDMGFDKQVLPTNAHAKNPDITSCFRNPSGYRMETRRDVSGKPRQQRYHDYILAKEAVKFIRTEAPKLDKPWVGYVGYLLPHPVYNALEKYHKMYYPEHADLPYIPKDYLENQHLVYQERRHFSRVAAPIDEKRIRAARAGYYGLVTEMDEYVGMVWDALEETGQLDNTIFIYTSDHGETLGEHGMWMKDNLYDPATRIPLVITGPGIPKNKKINNIVGHVDMVATILEWAGLEKPAEFRGHSLTPLMHGRTGDHPGFAYSESHGSGNVTGMFMIRKGDWKYCRFQWYDDQLFNIAEDPGELNNRINDPTTKEIQAELKEILNKQVDTEKVSLRAFKKQKKLLDHIVATHSEEQIYKRFLHRLGPGQSREMAVTLKRL